MAIIIPYDVFLHHILPRLPIKSASRFMCVSKELHSFLSSDRFQKLYNNHHQNNEKFLVLFNDCKEPRTFGTINCEALGNVLTPSSCKLPVASKEIKFVASFHGLVCVRITKKPYSYDYDLILWNPLTSDWKKLSENKSYVGSPLGLFYSSCEKDYKLVNAGHKNNTDIYSLKSDSWRSAAYKGTPNLDLSGLSQGTCLNENLYFLNDHRKYSVVKFDTKTETFTEMTTSDLNYVKHGYRSTLMVKKGCVYVCVMYDVGRNGSETEVWKINEEGDWMKMGTYRVDPCNMRFMKPLHLTRNGNLLMLGYKYANHNYSHMSTYNCKGFLYNVDLKKKHSKVKDKDKETRCCDMEISQVVRYTETVVSPNRYIKKYRPPYPLL